MIFINATQIGVGNNSQVVYMSDWFALDSLKEQGLLREVYLGGHSNAYDLTVTPKGYAVAAQQANEPFVPFGAN